jgi:tetratricopeptide (TPR) repeat protein
MRKKLPHLAALVLGIALLGIGGVGVQTAAAAEKGKNSAAMAKPLKEIQDLLKSRKYPEAIAKLQAARGLPGRTPYDNFLLSQFSYQAYVSTKDYENAGKAISESLESGFLEPAQSAKLTKALISIYTQLRNYDKVIDYGNRAIKGGFADEETYVLIGQAYYQRGDLKGSQRFWNSFIEEQEKGGRAVKEQSLQMLLSSCLKLKDEPCVTRSYERLVARYPKAEYWQNLMVSLRNTADDKSLLGVYRLMSEVDILSRSDDYTEMAQLAVEAGSPGEAQRVLEKAFSKNVFIVPREKDKNLRLLEAVKKKAAEGRAGIAALEAAAKTGDEDVAVGQQYLGYEMYDKAVAALQRGIAKGGLANRDGAQILLGIAQLRLHHRDEAVKAFKGAKGDPKLARLANLWVLRASQG